MKNRYTYLRYEEPIINLTPLIDVVFVILIMFIVLAPLFEMDRIELAGKKESQVHEQKAPAICMHVFADNSIKYNGQQISLKELPICLLQDKLKYPDSRPQLYHDKKAPFGTYQAIKNAVEESGFTEMDVILQME